MIAFSISYKVLVSSVKLRYLQYLCLMYLVTLKIQIIMQRTVFYAKHFFINEACVEMSPSIVLLLTITDGCHGVTL